MTQSCGENPVGDACILKCQMQRFWWLRMFGVTKSRLRSKQRLILRVGVISLTGILSLAGCGGGGGGSSSGVGSSSVVFQSDRDGDPEILRMDADGKNVRRVTENSVSDVEPSISRDGKSIAFVSTRTGNPEIFLVTTAGTKQITKNSFNDRKPALSSDGKHLVYVSTRDGASNLFLYDVASGKETQMTATASTKDDPSFTPDGKILFAANDAGFFQLQELDPIDKSVQALTFDDWNHFHPSSNPNGSQIVYVSDEKGNQDIYLLNHNLGVEAEPTAPHILADAPNTDSQPCFNSDGSKIYFSSNRTGNFEIYSMNLDGTGLKNLTHNPAIDQAPGVG